MKYIDPMPRIPQKASNKSKHLYSPKDTPKKTNLFLHITISNTFL